MLHDICAPYAIDASRAIISRCAGNGKSCALHSLSHCVEHGSLPRPTAANDGSKSVSRHIRADIVENGLGGLSGFGIGFGLSREDRVERERRGGDIDLDCKIADLDVYWDNVREREVLAVMRMGLVEIVCQRIGPRKFCDVWFLIQLRFGNGSCGSLRAWLPCLQVLLHLVCVFQACPSDPGTFDFLCDFNTFLVVDLISIERFATF